MKDWPKGIPLVEEIPADFSPLQIFETFADEKNTFFLDSVRTPDLEKKGFNWNRFGLGRFSFIGREPFLIFKSKGKRVTVEGVSGVETVKGNPFTVLRDYLNRYTLKPLPGLPPFLGGVVGYFGYDLCRHLERLPSTSVDDIDLPDCFLCFYDAVIGFDHLKNRACIVSTGFPETDTKRAGKRARERLEKLKKRIYRFSGGTSPPPYRREDILAKETNSFSFSYGGQALSEKALSSLKINSNFTKEKYISTVEKAKEYIASGDIYQVNLSQRFSADLSITPFQLYKKLRRITPAPFGSFLNFEPAAIVSASPERFLKVSGLKVRTRPMKGTRARGKNEPEDRRLKTELLNSTKDRAELVMIIDLERNDLGRVCEYGTVEVKKFVNLEAHPTVFQTTSTIEGVLRKGKDRIDLLKAAFPGGSITGAPKVRAMEIIEELEPTKRGLYTGSIGYLSFSGEMDLNIVIRTILVKGKKAYFQVGGGIVADSAPEAEHKETLDKAKALIAALGVAKE